MLPSKKHTLKPNVFGENQRFYAGSFQMTAKAVAQFDYDLVTDEPYKSILHVQAKQKLIKKVCQKPLSHESVCSFQINEPAPYLCHGPKLNRQSDLFERLR